MAFTYCDVPPDVLYTLKLEYTHPILDISTQVVPPSKELQRTFLDAVGPFFWSAHFLAHLFNMSRL